MSATIIYAALLVVMMSLINGCTRTEPERGRARAGCRGPSVAKRAPSWSPPRAPL